MLYQPLLIVILAVLLCMVLVMKLCFKVEMKAVLTGSMEPELPVGSLLIITPTSYDNVVGKVSLSIPYLGYIIIWTSDLKGKIIAFIIIAALIAISIFLGKEPEKQKNSDEITK